VFDVDNGPTNRKEAQDAVADQEGVTYGSEHPLDPSLKVSQGGIGVTEIQPGYYRVTANFEGNGSSGGTALFDRKWQVLQPEIISTEMEVDRTYDGRPIFTSSLQPFESNGTRSVDWFRLRFRRYEPPGTGILVKHLAYRQRYNSDAIDLPIYGTMKAKVLLFISVAQVGNLEQGTADGVLTEYIMECRPTRTVKFESNPPVEIHGWYSRKLDRSMKAIVAKTGGGYEFGDIHTKTGGPVTEPVLMNGKGWPLDTSRYLVVKESDASAAATPGTPPALPASIARESTADAVFMNHDNTEGPIAFAGLNFQANM
jgi:hypothetical protein